MNIFFRHSIGMTQNEWPVVTALTEVPPFPCNASPRTQGCELEKNRNKHACTESVESHPLYSTAQVDDSAEVVSVVAESEEHLSSFASGQAEESGACRSVLAAAEEITPVILHEEEKHNDACSLITITMTS